MESVMHYLAPPSACGYLPDQVWRLEYEHVAVLTPAEYCARMQQGWRRFGKVLFRPRCRSCTSCRSLRVSVVDFVPNRSQRRAGRRNEGVIQVQIGRPQVNLAKLDLYDRYHAFQAKVKGWPERPAKDAEEYLSSFADNPFATEEWCYQLKGRLLAVGYVDVLPGGLSAIYFFYDPEERHRSLGTWNVLQLIHEARERRVPFVYLGYYVEGCPSMAYKASFTPNQILGIDGRWHDFRS
jgi:arginine-tRNA-protein transferase